MAVFGRLFGERSHKAKVASEAQEAVLIRLNATDLPQEIYDSNDLMTLEDQLTSSLAGSGLGELDGNEVGQGEAVLYLYGADAEKLFMRIEPVLRDNPLCQQAIVVVRRGKVGAEQRELKM